jgi:mono/diheme cytochrome c family protein
MKLIKMLGVLLILAVIGAGAFIGLGIYNVAADDPHWSITYRVMEMLRKRSISVRSGDIKVPPLDDEALIRSGAGNFNSMCVGCHLSPGASDTELSLGLYPTPPTWSELGTTDPREAFWVVKHGVKMSGMPAWGKSMDDQYIWGMVALMQQFPKMTAARYQELVASSGGHQHGGGESMPHNDSTMPGMEGMEGADHHGGDASRSSFEPVDDPMAPDVAPAADDAPQKTHDEGHQH